MPKGRKWNEVVRKRTLISVFLSLVSCHLGSLAIVLVPHILLLQLALSVQRVKRCMGRGQRGKSGKHTRYRAGLGQQAESEKDRWEERGEWIMELQTLTLWRVTVCCSHMTVSSIAALCNTRQKGTGSASWVQFTMYFISQRFLLQKLCKHSPCGAYSTLVLLTLSQCFETTLSFGNWGSSGCVFFYIHEWHSLKVNTQHLSVKKKWASAHQHTSSDFFTYLNKRRHTFKFTYPHSVGVCFTFFKTGLNMIEPKTE